MPQKKRYAIFLTFPQVSKALNISQTDMDTDVREGKIKRFWVENLGYKAPEKTRKRIAKHELTLNQYVRQYFSLNPTEIIYQYDAFQVCLNESQKKYLKEHVDSNTIFQMLLKESGIDIDNIKLVIPRTEFYSYRKYIRKQRNKSKASVDNTKKLSPQETKELASQLCSSLKENGLTEKEIAQKLKQTYPTIYPSLIGRLLPANPGANIDSDSHRKRGKRLLEK